MYASQKYTFLSSHRRPETNFRHVQGHQRASAITCSINFFQSTIFTVYEVEHQKAVNTKLGKQTIRFSELVKECYHYFQEKMAQRHKKTKTQLPKMRPKKVKVFASLRWPETNFSHAQGHQRAIALTDSISFFQSTITTVYEVVQHQKIFKKNLEKALNGFQK